MLAFLPPKMTYVSFIIQEGSSRASVNCRIRHYVLHVFNAEGDSLKHCILKSEFLSKQKRTDLQPLASPRVHDSPFSPKLLQVPARQILPLKLLLTKQSTLKALIGQGHEQKKTQWNWVILSLVILFIFHTIWPLWRISARGWIIVPYWKNTVFILLWAILLERSNCILIVVNTKL